MIDEEKIIFFTGAPGSKWSAVAYLLSQNPNFPINISDHSPDRIYTHPRPKVSHLGAYWGPGFEFGHNFHKLNELDKDEIISEIEKPYTDNNWDQYRLIKCHQFSLNLDFIKHTFPKSKIVIVLRPDDICLHSWVGAGGFEGITYPDYNFYYKNNTLMQEKIIEENQSSKQFIADNNLEIHGVTRSYLKKYWNITSTNQEIEKYINSIEHKKVKDQVVFLYDILIATYNFS
jgi:hypothetical protein